MKKTRWPRQCFRLSADLLDSVSKEEIKATVETMMSLDIYRPPYDEMDIAISHSDFCDLYDRPEKKSPQFTEMLFRFNGQKAKTPYEVISILAKYGREWRNLAVARGDDTDFRTKSKSDEVYHLGALMLGMDLMDILVVLLATKNIVKETKEHKSVRLGIGKSDRHQYTTTLRIGRVTEHNETPSVIHSPYLERRPHLRRGHVRNQAYGPGHQFHKEIWIEPVFVNADPAWIAERTAYNVSKQR